MALRHAARRDANEPAIVATLEAIGIPYRRVSCEALGDLEIVVRGRPYLVEVKDGQAKYTKAQRDRREWLACHGVDLVEHAPTWRSVEDVFDWLGVTR